MTYSVAITGHTKGIGLAIAQYFKNKNYDVTGFSRSNGYNISDSLHICNILENIKNSDVFINNAYNNFDNSQLILLKEIYKMWENQDKIIINISSRYTSENNLYCQTKHTLDLFCQEHMYKKFPYLINLKPGLTNTTRTATMPGDKLEVQDIIKIIDYIWTLKDSIRFSSICFGK